MKKFASVLIMIILLLGVVVYTLPGNGPDNSYYGDEDPISGDEPQLWYRTKNSCPNDPTKTEYSCDAGGNEQCTVQNCP